MQTHSDTEGIRAMAEKAKEGHDDHRAAITEERQAEADTLRAVIAACTEGLPAITSVNPLFDHGAKVLCIAKAGHPADTLWIGERGLLWVIFAHDPSGFPVSVSVEEALESFELKDCIQSLVNEFSKGSLGRSVAASAARQRVKRLRAAIEALR